MTDNALKVPDAPGPLAKAIRDGRVDLRELALPPQWRSMRAGTPEAQALLAERRTKFYGLAATVTLDVTFRAIALARDLAPDSGIVDSKGREVRSLPAGVDPYLGSSQALQATTSFLTPIGMSYARSTAPDAVALYEEYVEMFRLLEIGPDGTYPLDRYATPEVLLQAGFGNDRLIWPHLRRK